MLAVTPFRLFRPRLARLLVLLQFLQSSSGLLQRFIFLAEAEAELLLSVFGIAVETAARDGGNANFFNQVLGKFNIVGETEIANVGHNVVGPPGLVTTKAGLRQHL